MDRLQEQEHWLSELTQGVIDRASARGGSSSDVAPASWQPPNPTVLSLALSSSELDDCARGQPHTQSARPSAELLALRSNLLGAAGLSAAMKARLAEPVTDQIGHLAKEIIARGEKRGDPNASASRACGHIRAALHLTQRAAVEPSIAAVLRGSEDADATIDAQLDAIDLAAAADGSPEAYEVKLAEHLSLLVRRFDAVEGKRAILGSAKARGNAPFDMLSGSGAIARDIEADSAAVAAFGARVDSCLQTLQLDSEVSDTAWAAWRAECGEAEGSAVAAVQIAEATVAAKRRAAHDALRALSGAEHDAANARSGVMKFRARKASDEATRKAIVANAKVLEARLEQAKHVSAREAETLRCCEAIVAGGTELVRTVHAERVQRVLEREAHFDDEQVTMHRKVWGLLEKMRVNCARNIADDEREIELLRAKQRSALERHNVKKAKRFEQQRLELEAELAPEAAKEAALRAQARAVDIAAAPAYLALAERGDPREHPAFRVQAEIVVEHEEIDMAEFDIKLAENPLLRAALGGIVSSGGGGGGGSGVLSVRSVQDLCQRCLAFDGVTTDDVVALRSAVPPTLCVSAPATVDDARLEILRRERIQMQRVTVVVADEAVIVANAAAGLAERVAAEVKLLMLVTLGDAIAFSKYVSSAGQFTIDGRSTLTTRGSNGHSWTVADAPLPRYEGADECVYWSMEVLPGGTIHWESFGIAAKTTLTDHGFGDGTHYGWSGNTQVYVAGKRSPGLDGWPRTWHSGDKAIFKLDASAGKLSVWHSAHARSFAISGLPLRLRGAWRVCCCTCRSGRSFRFTDVDRSLSWVQAAEAAHFFQ